MRFIDSHTGGEPTRLVISGGPDLGGGPLAQRLERMRRDFDHYRRALTQEPRGSEVVVGALLCEPLAPESAAGVIFFNNVGYLGMCGHGSMGLVATLAHLGRIKAGVHRIETPVGPIRATLADDGEITIANVPAYRLAARVPVSVNGRIVHGDVAWGGNWFFLCSDHGLTLDRDHIAPLTDFAWALRQALEQQGICGANGAEIDHIELLGPALNADLRGHPRAGRNFVLCPGKAYDRSPCGTGTSAKLACLAADGLLAPGEVWHQESVIGSVFTGSYARHEEDGHDSGSSSVIRPSISGRAFVNLDATVIIHPNDPFGWGL
jgi:4-hydroxyproline epimerase